MTQKTREWLPREAVIDAMMCHALEGVVTDWTEQWFDRHRFTVSGLAFQEARRPARVQPVKRITKGCITLECPESSIDHLIELALDGEVSVLLAGPADQAVWDAFGERLLHDLGERFDALIQSDAMTSSEEAIVSGGISLNGRQILSLAIPASALLPFRKRRIDGPTTVKRPLTSRLAALGTTNLAVEVRLGQAHLAIEDLKGLARGDVILLDKALGDPVDVVLVGSTFVASQARLAPGDDGTFTLSF